MKTKNLLTITFVFFLYALLLTPFGHYSLPQEQDHNPGYYSIRQIDPGDDSGYFAYLRSAVIDNDFDFFNEKPFWHFDAVVDTGYTANYWYIGAPMLWTPFFLIGHGLTSLYQTLGVSVSADGYSFPYRGLTFIGSALFTLAGLFICHACLNRRFPKKIALGTTLLVFTATCLPYFTFIRNRMSHSGDVFIAFAFFYCFLRFREQREQSAWFYIGWGLLLGLLSDLRYVSIVYAILPVGQIILHAIRADGALRKKLAAGMVWGISGFLIAFSPQAVFWFQVHGVFASLNPITILVEPTAAGVWHSFAQMFTDGTRGLFKMEFIWVVGLVGLLLSLRHNTSLSIMLILVFLGIASAQIVIMDPATFGQRYLLPALPALAWGLAEVAALLSRFRQWRLLFTIGIVASLWMYVLILNYKVVLPHNDPEFAFHALQNLPKLIDNPGLVRPTTFFDLLGHGEIKAQTPQQQFFVIVLPALLAGFALIALMFALAPPNKSWSRFGLKSGVLFGSTFCLLLSGWTLLNHPPLSKEKSAERFRAAAVSKWLKSPAHLKDPIAFLEQAERRDPQSVDHWRIRADIAFMQGDWIGARKLYLQVVSRDPLSPAWMQIERIGLILGELREEDADSLVVKHLRRGLNRIDRDHRPGEAIPEFQHAFRISNANSKYNKGLTTFITQFTRQKIRLHGAGLGLSSLRPHQWQLLGTQLNEIRFTLPLFDGPF